MQLFFFFIFLIAYTYFELPMIFKKIAYSYQSLLEFSCLISDRYISEQVKCQQKTFEMNLRDKNIPIPISSSLENTILSSHQNGNGSTTPARQYSEISSSQMERREELLLRPKLLKQTTVVESPPQTPRHSDHFSILQLLN